MRPSVTSATLKPRSCSTPSGGVSLCSSGMPIACGPWKRTTATKSFSSSPALKAAMRASRSEEHTSELQSLMRILYAVFCLKKKKLIEKRKNSNYKHKRYKHTIYINIHNLNY